MPCVGEYAFFPDSIASIAEKRIGCGTSKSGWPIDKLIGFFSLAANSKTFRIPLESKASVRCAIQGCVFDMQKSWVIVGKISSLGKKVA